MSEAVGGEGMITARQLADMLYEVDEERKEKRERLIAKLIWLQGRFWPNRRWRKAT